MNVSLVVIRSIDIFASKEFYESILDFSFNIEKHGNGPEHFSCDMNGLIFEIYPKAKKETAGLRIGFSVTDVNRVIQNLESQNTGFTQYEKSVVFSDIDGHKIEITSL